MAVGRWVLLALVAAPHAAAEQAHLEARLHRESAEAVVAAAEKEAAQQESSFVKIPVAIPDATPEATPVDEDAAKAVADAEAAAAAVDGQASPAAPAVQAPAVPQAAAQVHKKVHRKKSKHGKKDKKDEKEKDDEDDEDEDGDEDEDEDEDKEEPKKLSYHVGQEEMGKVELPKHWPLGPKQVLHEAGGVAAARRLLKENQEEQMKVADLYEDLEDSAAFEKRVDERVKKAASESDNKGLAESLGQMWKEMRKRSVPGFLPVLERREKELKEEEPKLADSLDDKGDAFRDKWTRSILKTKYPKASMVEVPPVHGAAAGRSAMAVASVATALAVVVGSSL